MFRSDGFRYDLDLPGSPPSLWRSRGSFVGQAETHCGMGSLVVVGSAVMKNSNSGLQYHRITGILPTTAMFFLLRGMAGVVGHVFFVSAFSKPEIRMKVSTIVTSLAMIILMTSNDYI